MGYFGGTFDPPHCGHLTVALAAADRFALDSVLLAPTGQQPLKADAPQASFADRLEMVRLLCEADPRLVACGLEAPGGEAVPNYTIDTLEKLRDQLQSGDELFAIVGADSFLSIRKWRAPDELLQISEWIVVSRPGFALKEMDALGLSDTQRSRVHVLPDVNVPVSATEMRKRLSAGEGCNGLVPEAVLTYIAEHQLYRGV